MIPWLIIVNFTLTRYFFQNLFLNLKPSIMAFKTVFIYKMIMVGFDTLLFYGNLNVKKLPWTSRNYSQSIRSSHQRFSVKKMFLEISQNSQENTCVRTLFLNKVVGLRPPTLLNERLRHRCFLRNFVKFLRTRFLQSTTGWLLLEYLLLPSTLDRLDRKESSKSLSEITKQRRFPFF